MMNFPMFFEAVMRTLVSVLNQLAPILSSVLGPLDIVLASRLLIVLILCGLIGLERSGHERATGFRPHILVGLGACLMTMAGAYAAFPENHARDPLRVASYVISGIGFLGAGAILRHGTIVRGVTTAASLWGSAGLGVAVGIGMGWLAAITTLLILFTLIVLEHFEARLGRGEAASDLKIHLKDDHRAVGEALLALNFLGVPVKRATILPAEGETAVLRIELSRPLKADQMTCIVRQLLSVQSISHVSVAVLEVEDVEELAGESRSIDGMQARVNQKLNDEGLLQDLSESEGDGQMVSHSSRRKEVMPYERRRQKW